MVPFHKLRGALLAKRVLRQNSLLGAGLAKKRTEIPTASRYEALVKKLYQEADRVANQPLSPSSYKLFRLYETEGSRIVYEHVYFESRGRLLALGLSAWLDDSDTYLSALQELIWSICNEYTWCLPAHLPYGLEAVAAAADSPERTVDLFAAETAHALAEIDYLLGDRLDPWIRYRIRQEIGDRVFTMFDKVERYKWESETMNWASVCGGCVGMAAMLLAGEGDMETERLAGILDRVNRAMECFLDGYGDDGGCPEGIGYWTYGFGYYVYFAEMLWECTEGEIDLLELDKIRNIASFPSVVNLYENTYVTFSDAPFRCTLSPGLMSRLQRRLHVAIPDTVEASPDFHSDHCYRWAPKLRDFIWTETELPSKKEPLLQNSSHYLPDIQWLIDKQQIVNTTICFAAKGGHNDEPHNHNDLGHFLLQIGEEALLCDLGAGVYTRESFRSGRYELLHNRSLGHSVPIIAGNEQPVGREREARVVLLETEGKHKRFKLDLTAAYPVNELSELVRSFDWQVEAGGYAEMLLEDRFLFTEAGISYEELFISQFKPEWTDGSVVWSGIKGRVEMIYEPNRYVVSVEKLESFNHDGGAITVYRTRLSRASASPEELFAAKFRVEQQ
jgi:hypothetical protein